jgi:cobyrinic acid a,c-diamide synthase
LRETVPRLLVAGLRGGGGKTLLSLGLAASWRKKDLIVAPFKKGPDYIDASWLSVAARRPCRNLDLFLLSPSTVLQSFADGVRDAHVALVEGNRGLFDGMDAEGSFSSAELAKLLGAPVLLSVDATKTTRTAAALVLGCQTLDPEVRIGGVVLNRTAGSRHETVLRQSIEGVCGVPVLGCIPRLQDNPFPERHLGLVPPQETADAADPLARVTEVAERYLELEAILALARRAVPGREAAGEVRRAPSVMVEAGRGPTEIAPAAASAATGTLHATAPAHPFPAGSPPSGPVRIGLFRDAAFQFYYPENLEALEWAGGTLVPISPLQDQALPRVDALYLGGGFPETLAVGLSENAPFMAAVREAAEAGLPIYAECGGAVYLGRRLHFQGRTFDLAGVLPVEFGFQGRPKGHGYTVLETVGENPFFPAGTTVKGHEFHYSFMLPQKEEDLTFAFAVRRGFGFDGGRDGLTVRNVLASYTHLHALGTVTWAPSLVRAALRYRGDPPVARALS